MPPFQVIPTPAFLRQSARLEKRYRSWAGEIDALADSLQTDPEQGTPLGRSCRKIRVAIASKNRGKSGGARLITLVRLVGETVLLLSVYDKSDQETITDAELERLVGEAEEL